VQVNGAALHYYERPGNRAPVLLVHGFAAEKTHWIRFVRYMPESFRYLVPDLPGHGQNGCQPGQQYDLPSQVESVVRFADAVGAERFHIAGNSMGEILPACWRTPP
jgi:pimeloyl-ACP methyl ester carboxylesterase